MVNSSANRRKPRVGSFFGLLIAMCLGAGTHAAPIQTATGILSGAVYDLSGAIIPGVSVTLTSTVTARPPEGTARTLTNFAGAFEFPRLAPGDYKLEISLRGFATFQKDGVTVRAGENTRQMVTLGLTTGQPYLVTVTPANAGTAPSTSRDDTFLSRILPIYPAAARNAGTEGSVRLLFMMGKEGTVQGVHMENVVATGTGGAELAKAAIDAVKQWRFRGWSDFPTDDLLRTTIVDFKLQP